MYDVFVYICLSTSADLSVVSTAPKQKDEQTRLFAPLHNMQVACQVAGVVSGSPEGGVRRGLRGPCIESNLMSSPLQTSLTSNRHAPQHNAAANNAHFAYAIVFHRLRTDSAELMSGPVTKFLQEDGEDIGSQAHIMNCSLEPESATLVSTLESIGSGSWTA
jgi:hypothetical protein